ncbi:tetratricopeptide repeat protein [Desulfolutivibrio sp.]|uniref:tetratricopeptide repeat protein n=1 Tax=Desulfolutivibrio sp. TaxID=2773296 RepID=UPI002F96DE4B
MAHEHPTRLSRRGMFQLMTGRPPDADAEAAQSQSAVWLDKGREAFFAGDMEEAAQQLRLWLRQTPGDDEARMLLGRALYAMGRHVQALVEFERVARRTEGHPAGLFLCLCRLRLGRTAKAVEAYLAWADAAPQAPGAPDAPAMAALRDHLAAHIEAVTADPGQGVRVACVLEQALETRLGLAAGPPSRAAQA